MKKLQNYHKWLIFAIVGMVVLYTAFMAFGANLNFTTPTPSSCPAKTTVTPTKTPTPKPSNNTTQTQKYNIYVFMQPDCPYCEQLVPTLSAWMLQGNHVDKLGDLQIINIQANPTLANHYVIRTTPTTVVTDLKGNVIKSWYGVFDTSELDTWFGAC
jgi:Glutaredoxin-like domain (DUF836).